MSVSLFLRFEMLTFLHLIYLFDSYFLLLFHIFHLHILFFIVYYVLFEYYF